MKFIFRILIIFSFFIPVSCLSSPEPKYDNASQLRDKIIKYDLKKYAEEDFNGIEKDFAEAKDLLDKKRNAQANKLLNAINGKYQELLDKTFPLCIVDKNKDVKVIQTGCLELKADVAVKDKYEEAVSVYNEALKQNEAKEYEKAIELFNKASGLFKEVEKTTIEKKEKADESFNTTKEEMTQLESSVKEMEDQISVIKKELKDEIKTEGLTK